MANIRAKSYDRKYCPKNTNTAAKITAIGEPTKDPRTEPMNIPVS